MQTQWTLQDAKNKFSEVVNAAREGTPQVVTRRGKAAVVVVAVEEYEAMLKQERACVGFADFLLSMPHEGDTVSGDEKDNVPALTLREVDF